MIKVESGKHTNLQEELSREKRWEVSTSMEWGWRSLKQTSVTTFREGKQGAPLERAHSNERDGKQGDHLRQHNNKRREEGENENRRKNGT